MDKDSKNALKFFLLIFLGICFLLSLFSPSETALAFLFLIIILLIKVHWSIKILLTLAVFAWLGGSSIDGLFFFFSIIIFIIFYLNNKKRLKIKREEEEKRKKEEKIKRKDEEKRKKDEERKKQKFEEEQIKKGLVKFISSYGEEKWGKPSEVKKWKEIDIGLSDNFKHMRPSEFEIFVGNLFEKMGYKTKITTKTPGDYGIDVIAKDKNDTIAIQAKKFGEGHNVSNRDVQRVLGSMRFFKANKCIIVTTSDFTVQAKEQAKEAPIELWNKRTLHEMVRKYFI